jgi:carbon storage regulator
MLVLSRKVGERIVVGEKVTITVVRLAQGSVRIGIEAPAEMAIVREELLHGDGKGQPRALAKDGDSTSELVTSDLVVERHVIELCDATSGG